MKYEGYHRAEDLPIKGGDLVRIPKGTVITNRFYSGKPGSYLAGKAYTVKVDHLLCGTEPTSWHPDTKVTNPSVCWAGPSGYWLEADVNDVEKVG